MAAGMQSDAEAWNEQLYITGGALEHSKCFWYLLFLVWSETNQLSYADASQLGSAGAHVTVSVPKTDEKHRINLKNPGEAHKTLGCWKAIDGSTDVQCSKLRQKSIDFAHREQE